MNHFTHIEPALFPIRRGRRAGYVNNTGEVVFMTDYEHAGWFFCGLAPILDGSRYGFINARGELVIEPLYSGIKRYSEHRCGVAVDGRWGLIDDNGTWIIPPEYQDIGICSFGRVAASRNKGFDPFYIDLENNVIVPEVGLHAMSHYSEGLLAAQDEKTTKHGYRGLDGDWAIDPQYTSASEFSEGLAQVRKRNGNKELTGYIDREGSLILPFKFETTIAPFSCGLAEAIKTRGKADFWGAIDKNGNWAIEPKYSFLGGFSGGLSMFRTNHETVMGFVDTEGCEVLLGTWKHLLIPFTHGVAKVRHDEGCLYINRLGHVVARCEEP